VKLWSSESKIQAAPHPTHTQGYSPGLFTSRNLLRRCPSPGWLRHYHWPKSTVLSTSQTPKGKRAASKDGGRGTRKQTPWHHIEEEDAALCTYVKPPTLLVREKEIETLCPQRRPPKQTCRQVKKRLVLRGLAVHDARVVHFREAPARNERSIAFSIPPTPLGRRRPTPPWCRKNLLLPAHPAPRLRGDLLGRIWGHGGHARYRPHHALGAAVARHNSERTAHPRRETLSLACDGT